MESSAYAHAGVRGVKLTSTSQPLSVAHVAFDGLENGLAGLVYFDLHIKLGASSVKRFTITGYDLFGSDSNRTFMIDFDLPSGQSGAVRAYERYGKVNVGSYTLDSWHRLTGRVDHDNGLYQVRFNGGAATTLDFRDAYTPAASGSRPAGVRQYHELRFSLGGDLSAGTADVAIDSLYVGTSPPAGVSFPAPTPAYTVQLVQPPVGSITLSPAGSRFAPGTLVTATVAPSPGYRLCGWLGALQGTGATKSFVVDRDMTIGAETCADPARPPAGRVVSAASITALKDAIAGALPNDVIELAEGTYADAGPISIGRGGVAGYPVTIRARTRGLVTFTGSSNLLVKKTAHVVLEGFVFETAGGTVVQTEASRDVRITRNVFRPHETGSGKWVVVGGSYELPDPFSDHNRVDHNRFEGKSQPGNFVAIDGSGPPNARSSQYDRIDRNHFMDTRPRIENGKEAVRVGSSAMSRSSGFTTIEANLFEDCDGDPEIVSIKSSDDTFRFNTIRHSQGALTLRSGDRGTVEGNFFFGEGKDGAGGVRLHGDDHRVFNNYFEGLTGTGFAAPLALTNGDADSATSGELTRHFRLRRAVVAYNTLVKNAHGVEIGYDCMGYALPPADLTLAYNLVAGEVGDLVKIFTASVGPVWEGNLMWPTGTAALGIGPMPGVTVADPLLVSAGGLWRIGGGSPAIDAGAPDLAYVSNDMDGQARVAPDIGADEFASSAARVFPLGPEDVGPDAYEDPFVTSVGGPSPRAGGLVLHPNAPNPFSASTRIEFSLATAGAVELAVHDIEGRRVALLVEGSLPAGRHRVEWRASGIAPGIYFCRLRSQGAVTTRGLLLLR